MTEVDLSVDHHEVRLDAFRQSLRATFLDDTAGSLAPMARMYHRRQAGVAAWYGQVAWLLLETG